MLLRHCQHWIVIYINTLCTFVIDNKSVSGLNAHTDTSTQLNWKKTINTWYLNHYAFYAHTHATLWGMQDVCILHLVPPLQCLQSASPVQWLATLITLEAVLVETAAISLHFLRHVHRLLALPTLWGTSELWHTSTGKTIRETKRLTTARKQYFYEKW